jgi:D-alanine-D-alanine ligase
MPVRKTIALLTGGNSSEKVISVQSARQIAAQLDATRYETHIITIEGKEWYAEDDKGNRIPFDLTGFTLKLPERQVHFDYALVMIHGDPAENGKLQGYLDMVGIPYSCPGVLPSALTFNKYFCKNYLAQFGVHGAKHMLITRTHIPSIDEVDRTIGFPCFVKPNNGGSSFGTSRVAHASEFMPALEKAFAEDAEVIAEAALAGKEITCGVLKIRGREFLLPLTEIVSKKEFFDYEAKYTPGMAEEITPARISPELTAACHALSSRIYDILQCKGIVRIDYILSGDSFWFLEVNTIPGMSQNSIIPRQVRAAGLTMGHLLEMLIEDKP